MDAQAQRASMNIDKISQSMRSYQYWCAWLKTNSGKSMKVPINPRTRTPASSNDRRTFASFAEAERAYRSGKYAGLGIGIFEDMCAIDIDNCIDANGILSNMAQDIVSMMGGYTEYSPSGRGLHIFFLASLFSFDKQEYRINNQALGVEVYIAGSTYKFITVTGNVLYNHPIADKSFEVSEVLEKYMLRTKASEIHLK